MALDGRLVSAAREEMGIGMRATEKPAGEGGLGTVSVRRGQLHLRKKRSSARASALAAENHIGSAGGGHSMRKSFVVVLTAASIFAFVDRVSRAADESQDAAAMAKALGQASVTLQQGLKASQR